MAKQKSTVKTKFRKFNVDRDDIVKTLSHLSYTDARRIHCGLYDALLQELYEANCLHSASELQRLVAIEKNLMESSAIRTRIMENKELLVKLVGNVKDAEIAYRTNSLCGKVLGMKLIYANCELLENGDCVLEWLIEEYYNLAMALVKMLPPKESAFNEVKFLICYKFGKFFAKNKDQVELAILALQSANDICRLHTWTNPLALVEQAASGESMHEITSTLLSKTILQHAKNILRLNGKYAIELTQKGLYALAEVGAKKRLELYKGYLKRIEFLIELNMIDEALLDIEKYMKHLKSDTGYNYESLKCQYISTEGGCYYIKEKYNKSLKILRVAYKMCQIHQLSKTVECHVLYNLGRACMQVPKRLDQSYNFFQRAKHLYIEFGKYDMVTKINYLEAKLKASKAMPRIYEVIRTCDSNPYDRHKLRKWKNELRPFWYDTESAIALHKQEVKEKDAADLKMKPYYKAESRKRYKEFTASIDERVSKQELEKSKLELFQQWGKSHSFLEDDHDGEEEEEQEQEQEIDEHVEEEQQKEEEEQEPHLTNLNDTISDNISRASVKSNILEDFLYSGSEDSADDHP